jgi:riboflavin synthase
MEMEGNELKVGIIPHTWENTNLRTLKTGDKVNVETDILAKYAEKLTHKES